MMLGRELRAGGVAAAALALLAGCALFDRSDLEALPTPLPASVPAGAPVVCGMDRASVEIAVGQPVSEPVGDLEDEYGCALMIEGSADRKDRVISALVMETELPDVARAREVLEGKNPPMGGRAPDVLFTDVLGGVWFSPGPISTGGMIDVFAGDRAIRVVTRVNSSGRDPVDDLRSLAEQVARTQGLAVERLPGRLTR